MKLHEKLLAIKLRKKGRSYKEIRSIIKVSKGTLSLWLRDVLLSEQQKHRLYVTLKQQNVYRLAKNKQKIKVDLTKKIVDASMSEFKKLSNNPVFISGLMLYWAEGDKAETHEVVKLSNSDPSMIKFMMRWFREICKVPEDKFRIALHIHTLHCRENIEQYWSEITKIPLSQFHKTWIKPTTLKHRKNPLYNGTCSIRICNKNLFRKIKGWKLGFQQKFDLINKTPSFNG